MNEIIKICLKSNLNYEVKNCNLGYRCVDISYEEYGSVEQVKSLFRRKKNVFFEVYVYSKIVRVFQRNEYDIINAANKNKMHLVELFFLALKEGKTSEQAKEVQRKYAMDNYCMDAFELIYPKFAA